MSSVKHRQKKASKVQNDEEIGDAANKNDEAEIHMGPIYTHHNYFNDQKRKIDFVLVSRQTKVNEEIEELTTFLSELLKQGVHYEISPGEELTDLVFIKLHCPVKILLHHAHANHILFNYEHPRTPPRFVMSLLKWKIFNNVTTISIPSDPAYRRAFLSLSTDKPTHVLSWERSFVLALILGKTRFGFKDDQVGIDNLKHADVIIDAYPTHDGPYTWRTYGPLTDRQLLMQYWANIKCIFKNQPIQLIYRYYGPNIAFYFAFLDFYCKMLVVPAFIGLCLLIYNLQHRIYEEDYERVAEICTSKSVRCPICCGPGRCEFVAIANNCHAAFYNTLFDNLSCIALAIGMSIWSSIFIDLWRRREHTLNFRWNLLSSKLVTPATRAEFSRKTKYMRVSSMTNKMEHYVPSGIKIIKICFTIICCLGVTMLVLSCLMITIYSSCYLSRLIILNGTTWMRSHEPFLTLILSVFQSIVFIQILTPICLHAAIFLTDVENPITKSEYYNSCTFKYCYLQSMNNYVPIMYVAFIKGTFFTYPADPANERLWSLPEDICIIVGCSFALTVYLLYFTSYKALVLRIFQVSLILIKKLCTIKPTMQYLKEQARLKRMHTWERDYLLQRCGNLFFMTNYMDFFIRYGFMIYFIAGFPIMPLLALVAVLVQIRIDAQKIVSAYRRPVPEWQAGLGCWNNILRFMTFVGAVSNAVVMAFSSDTIDVLIYRYIMHSMKGFVNSTFSEFSSADYTDKFLAAKDIHNPPEVCVYKSRRYPSNHPEKYKLTVDHWRIVFYKLFFVLAFQQVLWLLTAVSGAVIKRIASDVQSDMNDEIAKVREIRYLRSKDQLRSVEIELDNYQMT